MSLDRGIVIACSIDATGFPADPARRHESAFSRDNQIGEQGVLPQCPSVLGLSGNPSEQAKYRCAECAEPFRAYRRCLQVAL
jgi:hypothetical protein